MRLIRVKNFLVYSLLFLLPWQTRLILRAGEINGGYWEYGTLSLYASEIILWAALFILGIIALKDGLKFQIPSRDSRLRRGGPNPKPQTNPKPQIQKVSSFPPKADPAMRDKFFAKGGSARLVFDSSKWASGGQASSHLLLLVICYLLFVGFFALRKDIHFYYLLRFAEGIGLYFLIKSVERKKAVWAYVAGVVPQAILGIWQFLAQTSFANKWLGLAAHDSATLGTFVIETASGRWLRAYGGLPHPNILGGYLVAALLLLLVLHTFYDRKKYVNVMFFSLTVVLSSALFFTFSRSAWLALFAGFVFITVILSRSAQDNLSKLIRKPLFLQVLLSIIVFAILSSVFRDTLFSRLQSQSRLEVKSRVERVSGYKEAWELIKKHPMTGVGFGNYTYAVWKEIDSGRPSYEYQPVHNIFLLFLAEAGIVGAALTLVLLFLYRKNLALPAVVFLAVLGFFDHYFLTLYSGILLLPVSSALATEIQVS